MNDWISETRRIRCSWLPNTLVQNTKSWKRLKIHVGTVDLRCAFCMWRAGAVCCATLNFRPHLCWVLVSLTSLDIHSVRESSVFSVWIDCFHHYYLPVFSPVSCLSKKGPPYARELVFWWLFNRDISNGLTILRTNVFSFFFNDCRNVHKSFSSYAHIAQTTSTCFAQKQSLVIVFCSWKSITPDG